MEASDADLLQRYAREGSEAAFRELVQRHVNLVYGVAWRHLRSHAPAGDVAQSVFTDLARSAPSLPPGQPLVAWLHVVARRTAIDHVRTEQRRLARETAAAELAAVSTAPDWNALEPLLDEALDALDETDRHALLLRFFENRSLREVGAALGTSDDAAQKRVSRALEELRAGFARRGIALSATGLATQLPAAMVAAPAGLASSITGSALSAATLGSTTATTVASKTLAAASLVLAVGLVWEVRSLASGRRHLADLHQQTVELGPRLEAARAERDRAAVGLQAARQQADASRARNAERTATETALEAWLARVDQLKALIEAAPAVGIPEMRLLASGDWLIVTRDNPLQTEMQRRRALADLRRLAKAKPEIDRNFAQALRALARANEGKWPTGPIDLRPFLQPPLEDAILARYEFTVSDQGLVFSGAKAGARVFQEKAAVDADFDTLTVYWESGNTSNRPFSTPGDLGSSLQKAYADFRAAHPNDQPTGPEQLLPYLPTTVDPAVFRDFWEARRIPLAQ